MYFYLNLHVAIEEGVAVKLHKRIQKKSIKENIFLELKKIRRLEFNEKIAREGLV